jgi:hypothetical protein
MFHGHNSITAVVVALAALAACCPRACAHLLTCVRVESGEQLEGILRFSFAYDPPTAICIEVASKSRCAGRVVLLGPKDALPSSQSPSSLDRAYNMSTNFSKFRLYIPGRGPYAMFGSIKGQKYVLGTRVTQTSAVKTQHSRPAVCRINWRRQ